MTRTALPTNYITTPGVLLEDFETLADWTAGANGTVEEDTTHFKTGTKSLKINVTALNTNTTAIKTINTVINPKVLRFLVYVETATLPPTIELSIASTTNLSKRFYHEYSSLKNGYNIITIHRDDWINSGGDSWSNTMVRLRWKIYSHAARLGMISIDSMYINNEQTPKCLITFDDCSNTIYTEAYTYMQTKGLKGTVYLIKDLVGTENALTLINLQTMHNNGWSIGLHETTDLTTLTEAEIETKITEEQTYLTTNNIDRAKDHIAYPGGAFNDTVLKAVSDTNLKSGRTILQYMNYNPLPNNHLLNSYIPTNATSLNTMKGYIDKAVKNGGTVILCFHKLVTSPSVVTEWSISNFQALINYIIAKQVDVVTIDEWYDGLSNPRYRSGFTRTPRP